MNRYEYCTHPNQEWCDCDWCRLVRQHPIKHCACGQHVVSGRAVVDGDNTHTVGTCTTARLS